MSRSPIAFGRYVITRRIARGGMAEIYRARMQASPAAAPTWVAIKLMRPSLGHEELREQLFKREARIASLISHPNVVKVHEFGKEMERYFIAMEYLRGRDLSQFLRRKLILRGGYEIALSIGAQAAKGLGHAHQLRDSEGRALAIVHRDISPGNLVVSYDGVAKVLDFGVARINETQGLRTQTGTLRGKFAYMSPEQTLGEAIDARSDVFSLGTLMYELLTGSNPFRGKSPIATIERVQRARPAPPSLLRQEVPKEVDRILAQCLAKDPRRRYADASEIHQALAESLDQRGLDAVETLSSFMRDHFALEREEEERELEEEEEIALLGLMDFDTLSYAPGLDAPRLAISQTEEASQTEVRGDSVARGRLEEGALGVFDDSAGTLSEALRAEALDPMLEALSNASPPSDAPPARVVRIDKEEPTEDSVFTAGDRTRRLIGAIGFGAVVSSLFLGGLFLLQRRPGSDPGGRAGPSPTTIAPVPIVVEVEEEPSSRPRRGTIRLSGPEGSEIEIDGEKRPDLAVGRPFELSAGRHEIVLWAPKGGPALRKVIQVEAGVNLRLSMETGDP